MKPSNIADNTEKTWFLGTDILPESDLELMEEGNEASFVREEGAIYRVSEVVIEHDYYGIAGYSNTFRNIVKEAHKRGYMWLFFDCDITTEVKK